MRAGVFHLVLTLEDTVMLGNHFYIASAAKIQVLSLVHSLMLIWLVTNVAHVALIIYRLEMMAHWLQDFRLQIKSKLLQ